MLFLLDGLCSSDIYTLSNVGFFSKSGREVVVLEVIFLKILRSLIWTTFFGFQCESCRWCGHQIQLIFLGVRGLSTLPTLGFVFLCERKYIY